MLTGDSTDNIQGLPNITQDIADKYCTKVKNGIGPATVNDLFATATTIRQLFMVVAECYKAYYGEALQPFTSHRGEGMERNWIDFLDENVELLWMRREHGKPYNIKGVLEQLKII